MAPHWTEKLFTGTFSKKRNEKKMSTTLDHHYVVQTSKYLGQNKKCHVSGNPTDPTFLGPTLNFFLDILDFFSNFRVF